MLGIIQRVVPKNELSLMSYARMSTIATKSKIKLVGSLDESMTFESAQEGFTGKNHPGRIHNPVSALPSPLLQAINKTLDSASRKALENECVKFERQLKARFQPSHENAKRKWSPPHYSERACQLYLLSRMAPEYSALNRVFGELTKWLPHYTPKSIIDFGSGVGSVPWSALTQWGKKLDEIFCVDSSIDMINLAESLMRGGDMEGKLIIPQTYYKQNMPASANRKFDLVVSAYSLLEFPSMDYRLDTINNLWAKTNNYLILVEQGTMEGFKLIDEAKEFVLFTARKEKTPMHILAPCPHIEPCPRLLRQGDRTPCNFESRFMPIIGSRKSEAATERFSFVIIGKGPKPSSIPQWPRLVRRPLLRNEHTVCRMCTPDAKLEEVVFTKSKDGGGSFKCARQSEWGDLLPVSVHAKEFIIRDKGEKKIETT